MPSSGLIILSEEEERTLISEGYPVPTKWPLTKQEEKILKKIQRKIKNKVGVNVNFASENAGIFCYYRY